MVAIKAFGVAKSGRARKQVQRNLDRSHQKEYVPLVNRAEEESSPPVMVVVMGPSGSGKSTLIRVPRFSSAVLRGFYLSISEPPSPHLCDFFTPACSLANAQSLVKKYTRHSLTEINGPITVVTSKKRRLTFFECPNELNAMIVSAAFYVRAVVLFL